MNFDTKLYRDYLKDCFVNDRLTPFSSQEKQLEKEEQKLVSSETENINCHCAPTLWMPAMMNVKIVMRVL